MTLKLNKSCNEKGMTFSNNRQFQKFWGIIYKMGPISVSTGAISNRFHTVSFNIKRKFIVKFHTVSINKSGSNWQSNIHKVTKSGQKLPFF